MRVLVKTGNADLKFRVQDKLVDSEKFVPVNLDHNVQVKLNEGSLIKRGEENLENLPATGKEKKVKSK